MPEVSEITPVLDALVAVEQAITWSLDSRQARGDRSGKVARALRYFLPPQASITDAPLFMHDVSMNEIRWQSANDRHTFWTIRTMLFVDNADLDTAVLIAAEILEGLVAGIEAGVTLGGALTTSPTIRGAQPTLGVLTWAGETFGGFELFLDCQTEKAVTITA